MSPRLEVDHELGMVHFLQWTDLYLTEKPFQLFLDIDSDAADQRKTNLVFEKKDIKVTNLRGHEGLFSLDQNGFIVRKFSEAASCFQETAPDEYIVKTQYFPAVENLLRQEVDGIDRVFLLDWRVSARHIYLLHLTAHAQRFTARRSEARMPPLTRRPSQSTS